MSRKAFLIWRLAGAVVGAATWPFLLPLGVAAIPFSRWLAYGGWSAVLGWFTWATIGALVESSLSSVTDRVLALVNAFAVMLIELFVVLLMKIPVFDEPWALFEPALFTIPLAFGAAAIRISTLSVMEDLRRWRSLPRRRSEGAGLFLSVSMLVLAFLLMGWLVKTLYSDLLPKHHTAHQKAFFENHSRRRSQHNLSSPECRCQANESRAHASGLAPSHVNGSPITRTNA
jgi:hypothetical protein